MKAVKSVALGRAEVVDNVPIPSITGFPGFVLVKNKYVGTNPADYVNTDIEFLFEKDRTIGSDFCGTVVDADSSCTRFKKGDGIAGYGYCGLPTSPNGGCYAEYILVKGDAQLSLEALGDGVKEEQAATIGVALCTVFHGLYHSLGLPWPENGDDVKAEDTVPTQAAVADAKNMLLIYGGSSSVGMMAIQFAKLSGYRVITTCSPANFDLVRGLGADAVFDYHDAAKCVEQIRSVAGDDLRLVMDCIGAFDSTKICSDSISPKGGAYNVITPTAVQREDVKTMFTKGQDVLGEDLPVGGHLIPADQELFKAGVKFMKMSERLIRAGKIKLPALEVLQGLESIPDAIQRLREWKVSAKKLVCKV